MDSSRKNPRDMTDEETMKWMQELIVRSADEKGSAGGACSLEAVKNPVRRKILGVLEEKPLEINEISKRVGVEGSKLNFHLNFLESSCFIEIEGNVVDLTPGGVSFVRSSNRGPSST